MKCQKGDCNKEAINHFKVPAWDLEIILCDEHFDFVLEEYQRIYEGGEK